VIKGGDITFTCPGTWTVKAAAHDWSGGGSQAAQLTGLPDARVGQQPRWLELELRGWEAAPLAGTPYTVNFSDGSKRSGTLDANGFAHLDGIPEGVEHKVMYQNPPTTKDPEPYSLSDLAKSIKAFIGA
jgi:type VI secretion system secreted protein VgrG